LSSRSTSLPGIATWLESMNSTSPAPSPANSAGSVSCRSWGRWRTASPSSRARAPGRRRRDRSGHPRRATRGRRSGWNGRSRPLPSSQAGARIAVRKGRPRRAAGTSPG
jgi:hypothetical protein